MFNCLGCKAKDEQIKYLQSMIDSMLVKNGLTPALGEKAQAGKLAGKPLDKEPLEEEIGLETDIKTYGDA